MPREAKRRFVDLVTDEVSIVDTPANESEFLVKKNREKNNMSAALATGEKGTRVPVEVDASDAAVAKALEHVNGIVEKIAGLKLGESVKTTKSAGPEEEPEGEEPAGDPPTEEIVEKATMKSVLQACGLEKSSMDMVMSKLKAAGFDPNQKFPTAQKPITKAADAKAPEEPKASTEAPLTMATLAEAVNKAAAFTPSRIAQLRDAYNVLKLVLESVAPDASPQNGLPQVGTFPNTSAVNDLTKPDKQPVIKSAIKSAEPVELASVLKNLGDGLTKLVERVEAIEKVRHASKSVSEEGGTETKTQKSEGMWVGVL